MQNDVGEKWAVRTVDVFSELGVFDLVLNESVTVNSTITIPVRLYKEVEDVSLTI